MFASTFLVFYFVVSCTSSLSSFAAQTTPAASTNKTFGLKIIDFFFSASVISTHTRHLYIFQIHLICLSKFCYHQTIRPLESGDPGYHLYGKTENSGWKMKWSIRAIPFGNRQKIWAVI